MKSNQSKEGVLAFSFHSQVILWISFVHAIYTCNKSIWSSVTLDVLYIFHYNTILLNMSESPSTESDISV